MFLRSLLARNEKLVDFVIRAHQNAELPPDCYVIDLDTVRANAKLLADTAAKNGVELFQVAKQVGRVPAVTQAVAEFIPELAAIDYREAALARNVENTCLGNVGHLVQIPRRMLPSVLEAKPRYVTVYDIANLEAVNDAAATAGRTQQVLLKIACAAGEVYPGQEGGFDPTNIQETQRKANYLPNVEVVGLTGFPCFLYDSEEGMPLPTRTLGRVMEASKYFVDPVLDLPSHTSVSTIPQIAARGAATIGEPGHALTGTTPENAANLDSPEKPAMLYLSEVAQTGKDNSVFGGGFYPRGHARNLLGVSSDQTRWHGVLRDAPAENIDYYRRFDTSDGRPSLGDTAIMGFRTQIFVTRSLVAVVEGLTVDNPRIAALYDSNGIEVKRNQVVP